MSYTLRRRSRLKAPERYEEPEGSSSTRKNTKKTELNTQQKKTERRKRIPIAYGLQTPGMTRQVHFNGTPRVVLERLPELESNFINNQTNTVRNDDEISSTTNSSQGSNCIRIGNIIILIISVIFFITFGYYIYQGNSSILRDLKPSSELIILPAKNSRRERSELTKLKRIEFEKQKIKQNLFIQQECSNENNFHYDYALKSNGARILSTVDTEPYGENYINFKFLGVNLGPLPNFIFPQHAYDSSGPSALLEGAVIPGQCWAFKGSRGRARIQLAQTILIRTLAVEHLKGSFNSAPRFFSIMGIDHTDNGQEIRTHLGTFEFEKNGPSVQFFRLTSEESNFPYRIIDFHVTANHGNRDFTCVYRLRVYGDV